MSDSSIHPTLDLAKKLHVLAIRVEAAVRDELVSASLPGRTIDGPVTGGGRSDPTGGRALAGASPSTDEHPDPPPDPPVFGAIAGNRALNLAKPKLEATIDDCMRILAVLTPADPADEDGEPTGEGSCRVCGPNCPGGCRAVHPRHRPVRCDSCYRHRQRPPKGVDRTSQEVAEHKERMRQRERDRAEQRKAG